MTRVAAQRVLVVEDDRRLREMLHASIIEMGMEPASASSAEGALKLLSQSFFAVAVVDLNLPGMGGLELCTILHDQKRPIEFIILSGFGDLEAARKAIRLNVVDFLSKPCGMDDLEQALSRARERWIEKWVTRPEPQVLRRPEPSRLNLPGNAPEDKSIETMERQLILDTLARHHGNRDAAAGELGISVRKLYYRLKQYQRQGLTET
jgi:DNA-binding NtrC family response regulator